MTKTMKETGKSLEVINIYDSEGRSVVGALKNDGYKASQMISPDGKKAKLKYSNGARHLMFEIDGKMFKMNERDVCNLEQWLEFTEVTDAQWESFGIWEF